MNAPEISISEIKYEVVYEHRFESQPVVSPKQPSPKEND
jgi:hypothetical protein